MKSREAIRVYPVMEALQDSKAFVIWMRCPWAGNTTQEFFSAEDRLRPDLVLDFAEDKWATAEVPIDTHGNVQGPDELYTAFKQYYKYVKISKANTECMWISANAPVERNTFSPSESARHWRTHYSNDLENALKLIQKQRKVVLLVTAFGDDSWTKACIKQLFPDILGHLGRKTECFVLTSLPEEYTYNKVSFTWIDCSAKMFINQSRYMKFVMPPLSALKVMVNGTSQVLTIEQQVILAQYFDIIAVDPVTCKLVNSETTEDPDMRYLRGGKWSWHDVALMVQSKQFHWQYYEKAIKFLKSPSDCRQMLLRIIHRHNEGGTSMAVQLCYELAKLYPVVSFKQGYQPSSSTDMGAISRAVNDLSLQLHSPVVVFLGDLELDLIKLLPQAYTPNAIVYIACNALSWNSPRFTAEATKQTEGHLLHENIPTDRTLDAASFTALYLTKARQYHKTHGTKIVAASPTSNSPTVFDYSFCAFIGTHLTAEQYTSDFFTTSNEPRRKLLVWIAISQLFSKFEFNTTWLKDKLQLETLQSLKKHPLLCTSEDTTTFCHKQIAKYIMDVALANASVFQSLKEFLLLIPDDMLVHIIRRDAGKFSGFITEMRKCEAILLVQLIELVNDDDAFLSSDTKCHILIVVSRLLLKAKHAALETTEPKETPLQYAMRAYEQVQYEDDDYNADKAIALAHIAHVHKLEKNWEQASNYFRKSLRLQSYRHGALCGLIYSNCMQIQRIWNRDLWVEAIGAFYLLSVGAPFRCHAIGDQLAILKQYKGERDVGEDRLQIAYLELLTILDDPVEGLTEDDLFNSDQKTDSLRIGLHLKCPSFQPDLNVPTPTFSKMCTKFQAFSGIELNAKRTFTQSGCYRLQGGYQFIIESTGTQRKICVRSILLSPKNSRC